MPESSALNARDLNSYTWNPKSWTEVLGTCEGNALSRPETLKSYTRNSKTFHREPKTRKPYTRNARTLHQEPKTRVLRADLAPARASALNTQDSPALNTSTFNTQDLDSYTWNGKPKTQNPKRKVLGTCEGALGLGLAVGHPLPQPLVRVLHLPTTLAIKSVGMNRVGRPK